MTRSASRLRDSKRLPELRSVSALALIAIAVSALATGQTNAQARVLIDLKATATSKNTPPVAAGWQVVRGPDGKPMDFNKGAGSDTPFIWISQKIGVPTAAETPITAITIVSGKGAKGQNGWTVLPQDLNQGAGGQYLYLAFKRDSGAGVIPILDVEAATRPRAPFGVVVPLRTKPDYHSVGGNTNQGTKSFTEVFLTYKRDYPPVDRRDGIPPVFSFDARNHLMSSTIRDQGQEGSCVAFAVTSALATYMVNYPPIGVDTGDFPAYGLAMLDAKAFYKQRGFSGEGWNIPSALNKAKGWTIPFVGNPKYGVRVKSYKVIHPGQYYQVDGTPSTSSDLSNHKVYEGRRLMRSVLYRKMPLITRFDVYADFQGITAPGKPYIMPGSLVRTGGHAVMVIGFAQGNPNFWYCQNSWGRQYGRDGYFVIGADTCGIDKGMYWITNYAICDTAGNVQRDPGKILNDILKKSKR